MSSLNTYKPSLIENDITSVINFKLKRCSETKKLYYHNFLNYGALVVFFIIISAILYFRYKNKSKPNIIDHDKKKEYILSKIKK